MYIEFRLPELTSTGHGISFAIKCLQVDIDSWIKKHNIQYHKTKLHKKTFRLVLQDEAAYSFFALTWDPKWSISKNFNFRQPK